MASTIETLRQAMAEQLRLTDGKIEATDTALKGYKRDRTRIAQALKALGDPDAPPATKKRSPTAAVVRPVVLRVLAENERLSESEVCDLVQDELQGQGIDAKGLKLRVREALAQDGVFEADPGVYSLSGR